MVAMEVPQTLKSALFMKLATALVSKATATDKAARERTWLQSLVRFVLHVAGFSSLTVAAFSLHFAAGMIVAGLCCFALSTLLTKPRNTAPQTPTPRMR